MKSEVVTPSPVIVYGEATPEEAQLIQSVQESIPQLSVHVIEDDQELQPFRDIGLPQDHVVFVLEQRSDLRWAQVFSAIHQTLHNNNQ